MGNPPNVNIQLTAKGQTSEIPNAHKAILENNREDALVMDEKTAQKLAAKEYFAHKTRVAELEYRERQLLRQKPPGVLDKFEDLACVLLAMSPLIFLGWLMKRTLIDEFKKPTPEKGK